MDQTRKLVDKEALGTLIQEKIEDGNVPGLSVSVVKGDSVVWAVVFSEPMRPETPVPNVFIVTLELVDRDHFTEFVGYRPFIVHGVVEHGDGGTEWRFVPRADIPRDVLEEWLSVEQQFFESDSYAAGSC